MTTTTPTPALADLDKIKTRRMFGSTFFDGLGQELALMAPEKSVLSEKADALFGVDQLNEALVYEVVSLKASDFETLIALARRAAQPVEGAGQAAPALPIGWRDALRRSGANTDYHGMAAFLPKQLEHFVSMIAAQPAEGAGQAGQVALSEGMTNEQMIRRAIAELRALAPQELRQAGQVACSYCGGAGGNQVGAGLLGPDWKECQRCNGNGVTYTERAAAPAELPSAQKGGA